MRFCPECTRKLDYRSVDGKVRLACTSCEFVFWDNPVPVAAAVLSVHEKLVLVRPKYLPSGRWGLPAGYIEKGEGAEEAVIREIKEETNLTAKVDYWIGTYPINRPDKNLLYIAFSARSIDDAIKAGEEIAEIEALPPEEALGRMNGTTAAKAITEWLRRLKS